MNRIPALNRLAWLSQSASRRPAGKVAQIGRGQILRGQPTSPVLIPSKCPAEFGPTASFTSRSRARFPHLPCQDVPATLAADVTADLILRQFGAATAAMSGCNLSFPGFCKVMLRKQFCRPPDCLSVDAVFRVIVPIFCKHASAGVLGKVHDKSEDMLARLTKVFSMQGIRACRATQRAIIRIASS